MEIRLLTDQEKSAFNDGLNLAAKFVDSDLPLSTAQVQHLYDVILTDHADKELAILAVGLAFGETISQKSGYEWIRVADQYGEETALAPEGSSVVCYPISMMRKRISNSEATTISELRDTIIKSVEEMVASGKYPKR